MQREALRTHSANGVHFTTFQNRYPPQEAREAGCQALNLGRVQREHAADGIGGRHDPKPGARPNILEMPKASSAPRGEARVDMVRSAKPNEFPNS